MNIFALSVIKNEADIIEYTLKKASWWATKIFVLDNGSTDGTWEIVNNLSKKSSKIVVWKQSYMPFYEGMRSEIFNNFLKEARPNDWWCFRLDADEIYAENPRNFLTQVPASYDYVCKKSIDYVLTEEDIKQRNFDAYPFEDNNKHIKYFQPNAWVETRFFRHKPNLNWEENEETPKLSGLIYPTTILVKHYQYRSPTQMQKRLDVRNTSKNDGSIPKDGKQRWQHIQESSWQELLRERKEMVYDTGIDAYRQIKEINPVRYPWYKFIGKSMLLMLGLLK